MGSATISDAEAHDLVMKRFETMTREEWQARLDAAAEVFGRHKPVVDKGTRNGSHPNSPKTSKKPSAKSAVEVIAG
jgi:hypothetical protein